MSSFVAVLRTTVLSIICASSCLVSFIFCFSVLVGLGVVVGFVAKGFIGVWFFRFARIGRFWFAAAERLL
jgi:hypothetical protein